MVEAGGLSITNYEVNKQLMANEKVLDPILLSRKAREVAISMEEDEYWMLLCRERNDYTIFHLKPTHSTEYTRKELLETLKNRGEVVDFDKQKDGHYEVWLRDYDTGENVMYKLFECGGFIVEC